MTTFSTCEALARYASTVWEPDDLIEIRPLPAGKTPRRWIKASQLANHLDALSKENAGGVNLFAGVLPRTESGKGSADSALPGRVIWADFDHTDPRTAWTTAKNAGMPPPTMVIDSGHGAHLFWRLKAKQDPDDLCRLVKDTAHLLGSDPAVSDRARILRLPGFTNHKPPQSLAKLVYVNEESVYDYMTIRGIVPIAPVENKIVAFPAPLAAGETTDRARAYIETIEGACKGQGRNNAAFRVACFLVKDCALSDHDALSLLYEWDTAKNIPPLSSDPEEVGLEEIIRRARKYGQRAEGSLPDRPLDKPIKPEKPTAPKIVVPTSCSDGITQMREEVARQVKGDNVTIPLPWPMLSEQSKALRPGTVTIIGGPIKSGKSFLTMNIVLSVHAGGYAWRYLPLEDSLVDFSWRVLSVLERDYRMIDDDPYTANLREEALDKREDEIAGIIANVSENPRLGHKDKDGNTIVPQLPPETILDWTREALKDARVVVVDPISQIDIGGAKPWEKEADFIRQLLALAKDSQGSVILVAHTKQRPGMRANEQLSAEDLQGSSMYTRLAHTTLLIDRHEVRESMVMGSMGKMLEEHNRTVTIAAARNGKGTGSRIAYNQSSIAPIFAEKGILIPSGGKGGK